MRTDLKRLSPRSRYQVVSWEFSPRLFRYLDQRCSIEARNSRGDAVARQLIGDDHPRHILHAL